MLSKVFFAAALAGAVQAGAPPLNPTAPPNAFQAQQPRPSTLAFSQEYLDHSFEAFMATNPAPMPVTPTDPNTPKLIGCNHNTAPPPLNWNMWCADGADSSWPAANKAAVTQWAAADGTFHRKIVLDPQPGLTADALIWYTSALSPPVVEWAGLKWYWYELWHPIDHIESKNRLATPSKADALRVRAQTLIHERYQHAPASYNGSTVYETDAWFTALSPNLNWAAKRQEIALFTKEGGHQAWTLILSMPAEGVVSAELILGVPAQGTDPANPGMGVPRAEAIAINQAAFIPYFTHLQADPGAGPGFDAMSRHVVEEFSNLGRFVPALYKSFKANPVGAVPTFGLDAMGLIFNVSAKVPAVRVKNETLVTLGLPITPPGPKLRSPKVLPFLGNETAAKVAELEAAVDAALMKFQGLTKANLTDGLA